MVRLPHEPIHIALIDDEVSLCRSMGRLLRASGMRAETFASAEAFLAEAPGRSFDCIVLDIQLGGMSGLELHRRLVESGDRTPVIFITAHDAPEIREQARELGCAGFFRKTDAGSAVLAAIVGAVTQEAGRSLSLWNNPITPNRPSPHPTTP